MWIATDKDGEVTLFACKPVRWRTEWVHDKKAHKDDYIACPMKIAHQMLFHMPNTHVPLWTDEPIEIK